MMGLDVDHRCRSRVWRVSAALAVVLAGGLAAGAPKSAPKGQSSTRVSARDEELARRLLGEEGDEQGDFSKALSLMNSAGERLANRHDSSEETQQVQARALKALDAAIAQALKGEAPPSSSSRQQGESRKAGQRQTSTPRQQKSDAAPTAQTTKSQAGGGPAGGQKKGSRLSDRADLRRGWGYLPQRDREAILQGTNEEFHAKYREQIEEYYRAIAERAEKEK